MEVSLVFLGDRAMHAVNKKWRKRDAQANVLAFMLEASVGEVALNPYEAEREARKVGVLYPERIAYLFLHGLLHLYGYDHKTEKEARKMERKEKEILNHELGIMNHAKKK